MEKNKLDLVLHPVRMRIIMALAGQARTSAEISAELEDVPQATLYRHIHQLHEAGILEVVEERKVRNTIERVFTLKSGTAYASADELAEFTPEEHLQYFSGFLLTLLDDFSRFLQRANLPTELDQIGYQKLPLYVSPAEFADLSKSLNAALLPYLSNEPSVERHRRILALVTIPQIRES